MSKKGRKKGRSAKYRQPVRVAGTAVGTQAASTTQIPTRSVSQARVGGDQATVRAVELSLGARNTIVRGPRGRMVVQSGDPSIPLDRVPYFTRDLVRLAVVGAAMVVLLAVTWSRNCEPASRSRTDRADICGHGQWLPDDAGSSEGSRW